MKGRIEHIMRQYKLSATQFANEIGIQRSALSHIMSGRNKPSLDFVLKVKHRFPEISTDWLLLGKGKMIFDTPVTESLKSNKTILVNKNSEEDEEVESIPDNEILSEGFGIKAKKKSPKPDDNGDSDIDKIVFFYKNGRFKVYNP